MTRRDGLPACIERYTERARRSVFFARYEACQVGSTSIETEHLLLGLVDEDKNLTNRFLRNHSSIESIRKEIEGRFTLRESVSTPNYFPLSNECNHILAFAAEESERLKHRHIGTEHLLLGILRKEKCVAAKISRTWLSSQRHSGGIVSPCDAAEVRH